MDAPTFTVIMPVCGWPSREDEAAHPELMNALESVARATSRPIELLVGVEGPTHAFGKVLTWGCFAGAEHVRVHVFSVPMAPQITWGNAQRNRALDRHQPSGRYIVFQDQDDQFVPGALDRIAPQLTDRPALCRMRVHHWARHPVTMPKVRKIALGNVGGHMLVAPNEPELIGRWLPETRYQADFAFIEETCRRFSAVGRPPVWLDEVISDLRPNEAASHVAQRRATRRA